MKTGLNILYDNPRELGADRIVNAVAGITLYGGPLIIIDLGTATTFCAIDEKKRYLGGAVTPGIGISMVANKVPGVRCALCQDSFSAKMTRLHNNANMLALGGGIVGPNLALDIVDTWLGTEFSGEERHQRRIDKVMALEKE